MVVPHASASGRSSGRGSSGRGSGTFQQGRSAPRRRLHRRDEQSDGEEYDEDELPISDSEVGRLRRLMQKQAAAGNGNWGQVLVDAEGVARLVTEDDDASNANHGPADMRGSSNSRVPEDGPSTSGRNLETSLQFEAATSSVKPAASSIPIVRPHGEDKGTFFSGKSWAQLGATAEVVAALKSLGIAKPSHIQVKKGCSAHCSLLMRTAVQYHWQLLLPPSAHSKLSEMFAGAKLLQSACQACIATNPECHLACGSKVLKWHVSHTMSAGSRCTLQLYKRINAHSMLILLTCVHCCACFPA